MLGLPVVRMSISTFSYGLAPGAAPVDVNPAPRASRSRAGSQPGRLAELENENNFLKGKIEGQTEMGATILNSKVLVNILDGRDPTTMGFNTARAQTANSSGAAPSTYSTVLPDPRLTPGPVGFVPAGAS